MTDKPQDGDRLVIAGRSFASRLIVGTARFSSRQVMLDALAASGTEMVTASIRRISLEGYSESLVDLLGGRYQLLPNTAGCATVKDAVLTAQLARESLETDWVKLELIGDLRPGTSDHEDAHGLVLPLTNYPLFENALRAKAGRSPQEHLAYLGALYERFSEVAAN